MTYRPPTITATQIEFRNGYQAWVNGFDLHEIHGHHAKAGWQAAADQNENGGGARPTLHDAHDAALDYEPEASS